MKILLTNHHLMTYAGTEVFTFTIADFLKRKGHEVIVYSAYIGNMRGLFDAINVPIVDDLAGLNGKFDIAHVHHNINACEIRNRYPVLPIIFLSHGVLPFLEQPPFIDLGISKFLAVSEEVRNNLIKNGINDSNIEIFRNPVDENKFYPPNRINPIPHKAVVISNNLTDSSKEVIQLACNELSIECKFVGARFDSVPNEKMPDLIRQSDIVFSLGRGAIEAMLCGRIPVVLQKKGDGLVTPENFHEIMSQNFSGRCHNKVFTVRELVDEIKKYKQEYGEQLRNFALHEFSASGQIEKLIKIYSSCSKMEVPQLDQVDIQRVSSFIQSINSTRKYTNALIWKSTRESLILEMGGDTAYIIFRFLGKVRYLLVPKESRRERILRNILRKFQNFSNNKN